MVAELSELIKETHAKLTYGTLPRLTFYKKHFHYLLKSIVENALKHRSYNAPVVHVDCLQEKSGDLVFSVKDNGRGIDPVFSNQIFKIFQRLEGPPEADSTGMGLAICKKIVDSCGGNVWFEPNAEGGTTFFFKIVVPRTVVELTGRGKRQRLG